MTSVNLSSGMRFRVYAYKYNPEVPPEKQNQKEFFDRTNLFPEDTGNEFEVAKEDISRYGVSYNNLGRIMLDKVYGFSYMNDWPFQWLDVGENGCIYNHFYLERVKTIPET